MELRIISIERVSVGVGCHLRKEVDTSGTLGLTRAKAPSALQYLDRDRTMGLIRLHNIRPVN